MFSYIQPYNFTISLIFILALNQNVIANAPYISEIVAANDNSLRDNFDESTDWIEIFNPDEKPLNLEGWGLSDNPDTPLKWIFPHIEIEPKGFLLVHASGNNISEKGKPLHASFRLSRSGEFLGLSNPNGEFIDKFAPNFPSSNEDNAYGVPMMGELEEIIPAHSKFHYITPASTHASLNWENPNYNIPATWIYAQGGFGFVKSGSSFYKDLIKRKIPTSKRCLWIRKNFEINNLDAIKALILRIYYDDGFIASINGVTVASSNAPEKPRYNSYAKGINKLLGYENFDISEHIGLLKTGQNNVLSVKAFNAPNDRNDFFVMPILLCGKSSNIEPKKRTFLSFATPGKANSNATLPHPSPPTFSSKSGSFSSSITVSITSDNKNGIIRYTTDESIPSESSKQYNSPILLTNSTMLTARSYDLDGNAGPPVSHTYIRLASNVRTFTSNLPVVVIENFKGGGIPSDPHKNAYMAIYEPNPQEGKTKLMNGPALDTRIGIKIRGSSTQNRQKKAFTVEARDAYGEDKDIAPLGLPEDSDWILYAPYNFDRALIRNALIYELSNQIGRYAVRTRFCEVFVNTNGGALSYSDYVGVYVFMEKITRGKNRVNVKRISKEHNRQPEVTGGYMFKIDRPDPGDAGFSAGGQNIKWVEPKEEEVTSKQSAYVRSYFNDAYKNLNSPSKYSEFIDPLSWIDHHIFCEFTKNPDGLRLSTYFFKDRNNRIEYGPVWDFDRTMGCDDDGRAANPVGWSGSYRFGWWGRVMGNKAFEALYAQRWAEIRSNAMSEKNIFSIIDNWKVLLDESAKRNFTKWGLVNRNTGFNTEIEQLKSWISERLEWMDTQFDAIPAPILSMNKGSVSPGFKLGIQAQSDEIYYTTNGTDPKLPSGKLSPFAIRLHQAESQVIIKKDSEWKYLDSGDHLDKINWTDLNYNSENWKIGNAEFGYGDGDEETIIERGSTASRKYRNTIYFLKHFDIKKISGSKSMLIKLLRDDGAVVYLNGEELFRSNMPGGEIRYTTYSSNRTSTKNSRKFYKYYIDQPKLRIGQNILAVEVHRGYSTDKDISFNFEAAITNASGIPLSIDKSSSITVRAKSDSIWSAPTTASITVSDAAALKITEIMYKPLESKAMEFIELKNASGSDLELAGVSFSGVNFSFTSGELKPWKSGVLISNDNPSLFSKKHPNVDILGTFGGALSNNGEEINLYDPKGQVLSTIAYNNDNPWPDNTNGSGFSIERISIAESANDPNNWRSSILQGGTPGDILETEITKTSDGRISIKFLAYPGNTYSLHATDNIGDGVWTKLENNEFVTKQKVVEFIIWPNAENQFYRVSNP